MVALGVEARRAVQEHLAQKQFFEALNKIGWVTLYEMVRGHVTQYRIIEDRHG